MASWMAESGGGRHHSLRTMTARAIGGKGAQNREKRQGAGLAWRMKGLADLSSTRNRWTFTTFRSYNPCVVIRDAAQHLPLGSKKGQRCYQHSPALECYPIRPSREARSSRAERREGNNIKSAVQHLQCRFGSVTPHRSAPYRPSNGPPGAQRRGLNG